MNPKTLWTMLLGTAAAGAATDAESAWLPASIWKARGIADEGIDALAPVMKWMEGRKGTFSDDALPLITGENWNRKLWREGAPVDGIKVQPNRYLFDDAGNLQVWVDDHWNADELTQAIKRAFAPDPANGGQARNMFRLDELVDPDSELAKVVPELAQNTGVHLQPLGGNTAGDALWHGNGGGRIRLNTGYYNDILNQPGQQQGVLNVMEHELTHLLQAYAGQQGGSNSAWFTPERLAKLGGRTADEAYYDTLGERMARAAGAYKATGKDPLQSLDKGDGGWGVSHIPDKDAFGGHGKVWGTGDGSASVMTGITQGILGDPGTYAGLFPKLLGLGAGLAVTPSELGDSEQLSAEELQRQLEIAKAQGLIGAITGGGF